MNRRNRTRGSGGLGWVLVAVVMAGGCSGAGDPPAAGGATAPPTTTTVAPTTAPAASEPPGTATTARPPAPVRYRFPVTGCQARYGTSHHDSPASDRGADRGGRSVSLVGVDGVRYYGSHLEAVAPGIAPGVRVRAGQPLGRIGNSGAGRITPVHLHFGISWPTRPGIWWVRRGMVPPQRYLDSWRDGGNLSPVRAVRAARAEAGAEVPECRARC